MGSQPSSDWTWAALSTAARAAYAHTIGLDHGQPWRFVTWAWGSPRVYAASFDKPLDHDRIARLYGQTAAAHARVDLPAIQLRLARQAG